MEGGGGARLDSSACASVILGGLGVTGNDAQQLAPLPRPRVSLPLYACTSHKHRLVNKHWANDITSSFTSKNTILIFTTLYYVLVVHFKPFLGYGLII